MPLLYNEVLQYTVTACVPCHAIAYRMEASSSSPADEQFCTAVNALHADMPGSIISR